MAGLFPAIHALLKPARKTWMPATSAGMTLKRLIEHRNVPYDSMVSRYAVIQPHAPEP